jgi:hypothetical protein
MGEPAYKNLLTYKYSVFIYDLNKEFLARFVVGAENMRQRQQMDQAARSSKQCIVEGAMQGTSLKGYIKMLGVSRGSYEELLEDYKDIARLKKIEIWDKDERRLMGERGLEFLLKMANLYHLPLLYLLNSNSQST